MIFKLEATPQFLSEAKRLSKKYPSLKNEIRSLAIQLSEDPKLGTPLGKDAFKIRLFIASKAKGKVAAQG